MNRRIMFLIVAVVLLVAGVSLVIMAPRKQGLGRLGIARGATSAQAKAAIALEEKGELQQAKAAYQQLIADFPVSDEISNWQKKVEELNMRLLFSPVVDSKSIVYEIKPGDTLIKIAKVYKTTPELIKLSNNFSSDLIVPGRKIKVRNAPFNIFVDKSQNILLLKSDDEIVKSYMVSTGLNNSSPVGTFKIVNKLVNPTWFKAGAVVPASSPENILGTRWLGFDIAGFGIHGTTEPEKLGQQATAGCVRMANAEVEELYAIVPVGTVVTIVD